MEKGLHKVIIADDEYLVREHLKRAIDWSLAGFQVVGEVDDGERAIEIIKDKKPDLVIMDICMPKLDGIASTKLIKDTNNQIEVIILTGHDDFEYARDALRLGVSDYISKPIDKEEVYKALKKVKEKCESREQEREAIISEVLYLEHKEEGQSEVCSEVVASMKKITVNELDNSNLSLNYLASVLHMNVSHLSRKFKAETGMNYNKFLCEMKIRRAISLIKSTDMKNYEVASCIGIEDPNYYSYLFKKHMGISISDYKKTLKSQNI